jgi:hypothetical protein
LLCWMFLKAGAILCLCLRPQVFADRFNVFLVIIYRPVFIWNRIFRRL